MTSPGVDLGALARFLADHGVEVAGELRAEFISGGRSNLTYKVSDGVSRWVLRQPPLAGLTPSAHDVGREFRVTKALQSSPVPTAAAVACDPDGSTLGVPVSVVEYVEGSVIRGADELATFPDGELHVLTEALVDCLASIHAVDYAAVGLETFGRPDGFVTRQVALWARQWDRVKSREVPDLTVLADRLASRVPSQSASAIIHGDFRVDNTIVDPADSSKILAVLDWEMSTLGDPLTDVALMCVYRMPEFDAVLGTRAAWTSPRLPSPDMLAQRYAQASGRDLSDWGFYIGLSCLKVAVIAEGIAHRARHGAEAGAGQLDAGATVPEFIAQGLRALG
ncbi:phosphotransferase family protein [Mycolicibacterium sp. CH28]|uniref:phosphotransferase family protein n=1 Tax=Mycolicibacterium sp. CH28 TaxID=2512237 RepID=UPI00108209E1|nr:phosphotransferase family protein [Mycolicibacterium sp. CH28]TGD86561.1 phosphotransferase family protein [Mycolicibacterium sp. CH28]